MRGYLERLTLPRTVLWCYFIWYLVTLCHYFPMSIGLWFNSLGISAIIGTGLVLSTAYAGRSPTRLDHWQVFRLYLMPFCVSSFAATIKDRGFFLVFYPTLEGNLSATLAVLVFLSVVWLVQRAARSRSLIRAAA
ncbi:MAG TPA: hypothetical protein VHM70_07610 [Polyangiaceae bacterium]|jgi:hypothetical protein|nr:hypothetical protein [Polyangiaceae bacterium]